MYIESVLLLLKHIFQYANCALCICNATSFEELTFLDHGLWNQPWAQDPMSQIWISSGLRPSHWSSVTFLSSTLWQTTNRRLSPLPHTLEHCEYHFKYHFFSNAKSTMLMFMLMQFKYLVLYRWTKYGNESWPLKQNTHTQIAWSQLSMIEHLTCKIPLKHVFVNVYRQTFCHSPTFHSAHGLFMQVREDSGRGLGHLLGWTSILEVDETLWAQTTGRVCMPRPQDTLQSDQFPMSQLIKKLIKDALSCMNLRNTESYLDLNSHLY